jgi:hypothetical protein
VTGRGLIARARSNAAALVGGGVVWLVMTLRVVLLVADSSDRYIRAVPDDAFYYFQLARNYAEHGSWTFDGVAPTTGFHPLYAYLLVALHAVAGDLDARSLLLVVGLVSALALGCAAAITATAASRLLGRASVPLVVAVFVTPMALLQTSFLMEIWLVCLAAALAVLLVTSPGAPSRWGVAGLVAVGLLGELARTDYLVLLVGLVLGHLVVRRLVTGAGLRRSLLVLAGGLAAFGLDAALNLATSGSLLQASVRVKSHWTAVMYTTAQPPTTIGDMLQYPISLVTATLTPFLPSATEHDPSVPFVAALWAAAGIVTVLLVLRRVRSGDLPDATLALSVGCLGAVVGYVLVYSRDAASQLWYAGNLLVPCAVLVACLGRAAFGTRLLVPAVSVAALSLAFVPLVITAAPYVNQPALLATAEALRTRQLDGPVGAWNAGILGFVSERGVVNLDGLVNDDAVPYILDNRLDDYVRARGIRYVADFDAMLDAPMNQRRGGYDGTSLLGCLTQPSVPLRSQAERGGPVVQLWEIRPGCL